MRRGDLARTVGRRLGSHHFVLAVLTFFGLLMSGFAQLDEGRPTTTDELESWKRVAVTYPDLGKESSPSYEFLQAQINEVCKSDPGFFKKPNWPEVLAVRYATQLQALKTASVSASASAPTRTPTPAPSVSPQIAQAIAQSRAQMYAKYPDLARPGTQLYTDVAARIASFQQTSPDFFQLPDWPERIVESAANLIAINASRNTVATTVASTPVPQEAPRPTQYNGQPLPANWIDPEEADRRFQMQQLQSQINDAKAAAERARQGW